MRQPRQAVVDTTSWTANAQPFGWRMDADASPIRRLFSSIILQAMQDYGTLLLQGWIAPDGSPPCRGCPRWQTLEYDRRRDWHAFPGKPRDILHLVEARPELCRLLGLFLGLDAPLSLAQWHAGCRYAAEYDLKAAVRAIGKGSKTQPRPRRRRKKRREGRILRGTERTARQMVIALTTDFFTANMQASWTGAWHSIPNHYRSPHSMRSAIGPEIARYSPEVIPRRT